MQSFEMFTRVCVCIIVHNGCTQQHRTVLQIISPSDLQTMIIALMLSFRGKGVR